MGMVWDPEANGTINHKRFVAACHEIKLVHGIHRLLEYLDPEFEPTKESIREQMKKKPKSKANEEDDEEDEEDTNEGEIRLEEIDEDAANEAFELVDGQLRLANQKLEEAKLAKREHMFGLKDDRSLCVPSGVEHGAVVRQEATNKRA